MKLTAPCYGDVAKKLVEFFVVADGELEVTRDDAGLLVVTGGVASEFKDFGTEVFEDGSKVDGCPCGKRK